MGRMSGECGRVTRFKPGVSRYTVQTHHSRYGSRIIVTKQALVFANGDMNDGPRVRQALAAAAGALVIAADGGATLAEAYGQHIDLIVGDMDSLDEVKLARLVARGAEIERHSEQKDETDLELALRCAVERGATWIRVIGGLGGRLDQTLSNIYLLGLPILQGCDVALVADGYEARLLLPGTHRIAGVEGDTVSLIPVSGEASGITTEQLFYPLRDEALTFGPARGVSNVMTGPVAYVTLKAGVLLLVHTEGRA
jgi:thiamine pyrophosphokinase